MRQQILDYAQQEERVRAVLLGGSRADPDARVDRYSDYDVIFVVRQLRHFTSNHAWTAFLGKFIISQRPAEMSVGQDTRVAGVFPYLMLLDDRNRVDLTLVSRRMALSGTCLHGPCELWLDKDDLFAGGLPRKDPRHFVGKPRRREFRDVCNEFWWVSVNVAKGLLRHEVTYAKYQLETAVRPMLMTMIEWRVGYDHEFSVRPGVGDKNLHRYISKKLYAQVLQTYAGPGTRDNWRALLRMAKIFTKQSFVVGNHLGTVPDDSGKNVMAYLKMLYREGRQWE